MRSHGPGAFRTGVIRLIGYFEYGEASARARGSGELAQSSSGKQQACIALNNIVVSVDYVDYVYKS